ncbi:MAG: YedE family putative selenium transporter [bacterium]|nr:YedE family putative selenium transporter [bacterium]MDT8395012.1 YedE family putative selenium transporter [bacterium]
MRRLSSDTLLILASGISLGGLGAALALWGNPANSGICISCFVENLSGSLGLHHDLRMSYFRPELAGFVAGAFLMALAGREMRPRSGTYPVIGFVLGVLLIAGSSVFMGCPIKMMLRLGAGDLTAVAGVAGLAFGVWIGVRCYRAGLDLGAPTPGGGAFQASLLPLVIVAGFGLSVAVGGLFLAGDTGPAARRAPLVISLAAGLIIGALAQRSRFCVTGSFSNYFLARDTVLMRGLAALFLAALSVSVLSGVFNPGLLDQPGSHPDHLWNFLGMALVGFASVLAGGCPFRQLVLSGEGSVDASVVVLGMVAGGAIVHLWGIASTSAGPTPFGKAAVLLGLAFCFGIARFYRKA